MQHPYLPLLPSNSNLKPFDPLKQSRIMENLKAAVLDRLAKFHPNKPLSTAQIAAVELRLNEAFPAFRIPTHPTYSVMIENAIKGLNEEDGSREDAISEYILANYEGLPWAHKRFLSHYLEKLCQSGDIVCTSSKCYSLPSSTSRPSLKKKKLTRKSGRKRKECVIEEVNLSGKEVNVVNENELCFQEEQTQRVGKIRIKRRRNNWVVLDDDEGMGGTEVAVREDNMVVSSEIPVIDGRKEVLEWEVQDEVDRKDSKLEQHHTRTDGEDHGAAVVGECSPASQLVKSTTEKLPPEECQDEVRTEDLALDNDPSEGKAEQQLLVPSTMEKTQPGEHEDEARTGLLPLGNLMILPTDCVKTSTLVPFEGDPTLASGTNVDGDAPKDTLEKLALKENDYSSRAADLMMVPFEGDSPEPVVEREIICALAFPVQEQQKQKQQMYRPRNRSKRRKEEPALSSVKPVSVSLISPMGTKLVDHEKLCKVSPSRGLETKLNATLFESSKLKELPLQSPQAHTSLHELNSIISLTEGSIEHELENQKLHSESSHSNGQWKLMSTEDEDLNIPLQQVLEEHCKQRKPSLQTMASKTPSVSLASSMSGAKQQAELPNSENPAKMMSQGGEKMTAGSQEHQNEQKYRVELAAETLSIDDNDKIADQQQKIQCPISQRNPDQSAAKFREGNASTWNQSSQPKIKGPKRARRGRPPKQKETPSEAVANLIIEQEASSMVCQFDQKGEKNDGWDSGLHFESSPTVTTVGLVFSDNPSSQHSVIESLSAKPASQCHLDQVEEVGLWDSEQHLDTSAEGKVPISNRHSLQPIKQLKIERRGIPRKKKQETLDATASLNLHIQQQDKPLKKDGRGRHKKQKVATTADVAAPLNFHDQQQGQEGSSKPATCQPVKKDGRGRPKKEKEATREYVAVPLNVHDQKKEDPSEPANYKSKKKDGRGRPRKHKEDTMEDVTALNLLDQQQEGPSELATDQVKKKEHRGRPRKQKKAATEDVKLHDQHQEGASKPATGQMKKDGRGRLRKSKGETIANAEAPLNLSNHQQEWPSKPAVTSFLDVASVLCQPPDEKKIQQQETDREVGCPDFELSATSEGQVSLHTLSNLLQRKQKQDYEAATTFSDSQTDQKQCHELELSGLEKPPKLSDHESQKQEKEHKPEQEEKQLQPPPNEKLVESQGEVHGVLSEAEQVKELSYDQTPQQEEQCQHHEEKQGKQLSSQGTVPEQKSAKAKPIQVPLSSINQLRSRIKRQSLDAT